MSNTLETLTTAPASLSTFTGALSQSLGGTCRPLLPLAGSGRPFIHKKMTAPL
jgi:hypothetical protein